MRRRLDRSQLSALGDGVQFQLGLMVGRYLMESRVTAQSSNVVPMLTLEQMDLAEAAFLKLMKARHPGRPVTVRRLDADTIAERRAARLNQDGEADAA